MQASTTLRSRPALLAEDENQERYKLEGWSLQAVHDFARPAPSLALIKELHHGAGSLAAHYDLAARGVAVSVRRGGLVLSAQLGRNGTAWHTPAVQLSIEPLAFL